MGRLHSSFNDQHGLKQWLSVLVEESPETERGERDFGTYGVPGEDPLTLFCLLGSMGMSVNLEGEWHYL